MSDFEYEYFSLEERANALRERIRVYEGKLFDTLMNAKAESVSSNPNKHQSIRILHEQAEDLKNVIELTKHELEILLETANLETETSVTDA